MPTATPLDIDELEREGRTVDEVTLNIDYRIIEHFSKNLYSSENKAIEELVSNGFDAFAEQVYTYIPGDQVSDHVVVWDDGHSMDVDGLKDLWVIAASPKRGDRVRSSPRGDGERKLIGKFGIGKLASYTVGNTIVHLCRDGDRFLLVSVDYADIHGEDGKGGADLENPLRKPIVEVEEEQARSLVEDLFNDGADPDAYSLFEEDSWTLAVISDLKVQLKAGRLAWVLGNGMPLRPDFRVWVNDEEVTPKYEKGAIREWDFGEEKVVEAVQSRWQDAVEDGEVRGEPEFGTEKGLDDTRPDDETRFVEFPELGKVWGSVRLFDRSLKKGRAAEQGRSQGFFIIVLGRLINPTDDTFLLHPPQYGTFNRSQFLIHADELDEDLLADRSGVQEDTPRVRELAVLQRALYQAARNELERLDEDDEVGDLRSILPTGSRPHFRQPLMALLTAKLEAVPEELDVSNPVVEPANLPESERVARLDPEAGGFQVNTGHPFFGALKSRLGSGSKKARAFERWYHLFAVSDLLFEGHLHDAGLGPDEVDEHMEWRDDLYRKMAESFEMETSEPLVDLHNASFSGDEEFERAIATVLRAMGFDADRRGGDGEEDVYLVATLGPESYTLTFEAKGSKGPITAKRADVAGVASHREHAEDAEHAVIVAREFEGFSDPFNTDAALYKKCESTGRVSFMTTEALEELFDTVQQYAYPLHLLKDVFVELAPPGEKLKQIRTLRDPTEVFDYRQLLEDIWEQQQGVAAGDVVPYRSVWQQRGKWKERMDFDEFQQRILALETLAAPLIMTSGENIHLRQDPAHIAERITTHLERQREDRD